MQNLKAGQWVKCINEELITTYDEYSCPIIRYELGKWYQIKYSQMMKEMCICFTEKNLIYPSDIYKIMGITEHWVSISEDMHAYFDFKNPLDHNPNT